MKGSIFQSWISERYKFPILLLIAITLSCNSGIPSTIYPFVMGALSANSPDLSMAMYAYCAGMVCSIPLIFRLGGVIPKKTLIIFLILVLIAINFLLAINDNVLVNVMLMFVFGCVKIIVTMALITELMPYLMPKGERYQMYAVYYPMNMILPVIGGLISVMLAQRYYWEIGFHFQNLMLFICLLLVLCTFKTQAIVKIPLFQYDWFGTILLASSLLSFSFVCSYAVQNNWFYSPSIIIATVLTIVFFMLFFNRNYRKKRKVISFSTMADKGTFLTLLTIFLLGMFYANSSLLNYLLNNLVPNNPGKVAEINAYVIIGYLIGSLIVWLYFKCTKKCKAIMLFATLCYLASNILMYRYINTNTAVELLITPIILRGIAIIVSFIATAVYLAANVNPKQFLHSIVLFLLVRTFIVTVFWSSFINYWYQHQVAVHQTRLAEIIENSIVLSRTSLASFQTQTALLALQDVYWYLILANIAVLLIIAILPYHSSTIRHIYNWATKKNAKELIQASPM